MEYSESILVDFYTWCFTVSPDLITTNSASSTDGLNVASIYQAEVPAAPTVWCVSAQSESTTITSFEVDLASCIEMFKRAWSQKDNLT